MLVVVCVESFPNSSLKKCAPLPLPSVRRHGLPLRGGDAAAGLSERPGCEGQAATEGGHAADHLGLGGQGAPSRGKLGNSKRRSEVASNEYRVDPSQKSIELITI